MATERRKRRQKGQEIMEFGLVALLFVPLLVGSFVVGLNLIRSNQANQVCRDVDDMYIHGADFSSYPMQQLAQRLALGLNLQIGSSFSGNNNANTGNGGSGLVTVTQIMYIGATSDANCLAVGAGNCTNHDSFVFTQRITFGNGTLATQSPSTLGTTSAVISSSGVVQNDVTDSRAKVSEPAQTNLRNLWQVSSGGRTPLQDGQVCYIVETYFKSPDLGLGSFPGQGVYARYFF